MITTANAVARGGPDTIESVDRQGNRHLIEAAVGAGVERFIFTSALGATPDSPIPLLQAKGEAEQALRDSGMSWTILQPNLYMELWIPLVVGRPALAGAPVTLVGEGRRIHSMVSRADVAAFAVAALEREEAHHQTLVIGGPQPVSWRDVVAAFERRLGRDIPIRTLPLGEQLPGFPPAANELLTALATYDSPIDMTDLFSVYGVTPTTLDGFVAGFVAATASKDA